MTSVDILAIAAHRDDVELTCGGTLLKAARLGRTTAILDLTAGETGTRGSAQLRGEEATAAAKVLKVVTRENLADLATDELMELAIDGMDESRAANLIMAAREEKAA